MNGFEQRKAKKIENIRQAALQLFAQFGVHKTSINEIAEKARVSQATIFNYFGSKEQLVLDVFTYRMDRQLADYKQLLESDTPFPQIVKQIIMAETEILNEMPKDFFELREVGHTSLIQFWETYELEKVVPFIQQFIRIGQQKGYFLASLQPETVMAYFDMYKNQLLRMMQTASPSQYKSWTEEFTNLFFYGLVGQKPVIMDESE